MDLTLLPSGNFDTNYLVCALAAVAMNLLRLIGQRRGCHLPDGQVKFPHPWPPQIPPGRTTRL